MKLILAIVLLSLLSCQKDNLNLRVLSKGTVCTIVAGTFDGSGPQPAQPVTIDGVYNQGNHALIYYSVTDSQGAVWEIPDGDLVVSK
jgi:hypothetical protein